MTITEISIGQAVRIRRGNVWLSGEVVHIGRSVAHVKIGNAFLGYRTFVEQLKTLKSTDHSGVAKDDDQ